MYLREKLFSDHEKKCTVQVVPNDEVEDVVEEVKNATVVEGGVEVEGKSVVKIIKDAEDLYFSSFQGAVIVL